MLTISNLDGQQVSLSVKAYRSLTELLDNMDRSFFV
jgi:hypothetical protein